MSNNLIGNIVDWFKAAKPEPTAKDAWFSRAVT